MISALQRTKTKNMKELELNTIENSCNQIENLIFLGFIFQISVFPLSRRSVWLLYMNNDKQNSIIQNGYYGMHISGTNLSYLIFTFTISLQSSIQLWLCEFHTLKR